MTQKQLLDHHARLDGLAQTNVIGQKKIRSWRRKRSSQRFQLVRLKVRSRAEWRLELFRIRTGYRTPTHSIDERSQLIWIIERSRIDDVGQSTVRNHALSHFKFPNDRQLITHPVLFE